MVVAASLKPIDSYKAISPFVGHRRLLKKAPL